MSAFPPKADMTQRDCDVRFVPKADAGAQSPECPFTLETGQRAHAL
jgi:hypothetical protein